MKRIGGLVVVIGIILAVILAACEKESLAAQPTVNVGFIWGFTGPLASWGIQFERSIQHWVDETNAQGGLKAGDKTYKVILHSYDDGGFIPSQHLDQIRRAQQQDGCVVVFTTPSATIQQAIGPYVTKNKLLALSWGAGALNAKKRPYQLAVHSGWPLFTLGMWPYMHKTYPEIQKVAILAQDTVFGVHGAMLREIGGKAEGYDIVISELYAPETVDFYPLMSRVLASEPDLIAADSIPSTQWATIVKTGMDLGYKGRWSLEEYDSDLLLKKVPASYAEGMVSATPSAGENDKLAPAPLREFRTWYDSQYPGEWNTYNPLVSGTFLTWAKAAELAGDIDPSMVRNALLSTDPFPRPFWGNSYWGGEELWGGKIQMFTPMLAVALKNGELLIQAKYSFPDWWKEHKDVALPILEKHGLLHWQEK
jgi:branched-chain amino acid transport system substrate-binding protein